MIFFLPTACAGIFFQVKPSAQFFLEKYCLAFTKLFHNKWCTSYRFNTSEYC